jgi:hypothetical protein
VSFDFPRWWSTSRIPPPIFLTPYFSRLILDHPGVYETLLRLSKSRTIDLFSDSRSCHQVLLSIQRTNRDFIIEWSRRIAAAKENPKEEASLNIDMRLGSHQIRFMKDKTRYWIASRPEWSGEAVPLPYFEMSTDAELFNKAKKTIEVRHEFFSGST